MSIKLMAAVWDLALPLPRKMVLLSLADQANDGGECFPSIATIERRTGAGRRTVFEQLQQLEQMGVLTRVQISKQRLLFKLNYARMRDLAIEAAGAAGAPPIGRSGTDSAGNLDGAGGSTGAGAAPVRQPHRGQHLPAGNPIAAKQEQQVTDDDECASRTGAPAAPVQLAHQPVHQPHSTGASAAPNRCASRTPIKATPIEPPRNPHSSAPEGAGEGSDLEAPVIQLTEEQRIDREDQFNRLPAFDQQLIESFLSRLPPSIELRVFAAFVRHRGGSGRQLSWWSAQQVILELRKLEAAGHDPNKSLIHTMGLGYSLPVAPPSQQGAAARNSSRPKANDDFSGATYESTQEDDLPAELR